jgi:hypothetical protein
MTEPINLSELLRAMKDAGISGSGSFTVVELCEAGGIGAESARTLIKRALKAGLMATSRKTIQSMDGRQMQVPSYLLVKPIPKH